MIVVIELDVDGTLYTIGEVEVPSIIADDPTINGFDGGRNIGQMIDEYFAEWRGEVPHPEADSQFIDWLVEKKGWKRYSHEVLVHVISN